MALNVLHSKSLLINCFWWGIRFIGSSLSQCRFTGQLMFLFYLPLRGDAECLFEAMGSGMAVIVSSITRDLKSYPIVRQD